MRFPFCPGALGLRAQDIRSICALVAPTRRIVNNPQKCPTMNDLEKNEQSPVPRFFSQWNGKEAPSRGQRFTKPTCTIPDQSMTIQEIIAKFTRTGLVPQSYAKRDEGGNTAFDPDFDPLDEGGSFMAEARAAAKAKEEASEEPAKDPAGAAEPAPPAE